MATPRQELLKLQLGAETTAGTHVAATSVFAWIENLNYGPLDTVESPPTRRGSLAVYDTATVLATAGAIQMDGFLAFDDFCYLLNAGYKNQAGTGDGGSPQAYTRTYTPTLTSEDTPKTYTLEVGENVNAWEGGYGFLTSFELSAQVRGWTRFTANWMTQDWATTTFTGALSRRRPERVRGQKWKVYIDDTSGTIGTTQITDCIMGFNYRSGDLYGARACLNGNDFFESHTQMGQAPRLTLNIHDSATVASLYTDYRAGTKKLIRLQNEGSQIHGGSAVNYRIRIDLAASILEWGRLGGQVTEMGITLPIVFTGCEDVGGTWAKLVEYAVVNALSALP